MGRLTDTLLNPVTGVARGSTTPVLNPMRGGQMAYAPNYTEWINNQQYIRRNLICILLEAPTGFAELPNPDFWVGTLRAIMEMHALRITGLTASLTVETADTPFGGGGQMQEDPTDVKEAQSRVTVELNEKYGMPFARFFDAWIRHLIMDPHSKFATMSTFGNRSRITDMLADRYSMTCAFIEPDPVHNKVVKAWLGTGMYPKSNGEIIGSRDLTAAGEPANYSIEFAGIYQYGSGVNRFCQTLLDAIDITGAAPFGMAPFIDKVSNEVLATSAGYTSNVAAVAKDGVQL